MTYSLAQAAKARGMSKKKILRAIRTGKISATKDNLGRWQIEPRETKKLPKKKVQIQKLPPNMARGAGNLQRWSTMRRYGSWSADVGTKKWVCMWGHVTPVLRGVELTHCPKCGVLFGRGESLGRRRSHQPPKR